MSKDYRFNYRIKMIELAIIDWCKGSFQRERMINKMINTFKALGVSRAETVTAIHAMIVETDTQDRLDNLTGLS